MFLVSKIVVFVNVVISMFHENCKLFVQTDSYRQRFIICPLCDTTSFGALSKFYNLRKLFRIMQVLHYKFLKNALVTHVN